MAIKVTGILGKKVGMTQLFDSKGDVRPVTVLQAGPCVVTQHKSATKDGYEAAQIGLVEFVKESRLTKAQRGHLAKNDLPPVKFLREVPLESDGDGGDGLKVGARVLVEIFEGEKFVDIIGVSKGRGFQGVVKRHHFGGGPKSHGSMFQITGSIGSSAFPSRVFKGMRMSGHMGNSQVTVRNLRVLGVDKDENLLVVEGSVPGPQGGYLVITKAQKPPREGTLDLADEIFGAVNEDLLWEAVKHYRAGQHQGTHATKARWQVSGSGKKLWKQKGTGRARIGSIRSPLWRHGGTVHGPQPRSYDYAFPRKKLMGALRSALAAKLADGKLIVVNTLDLKQPKTKQFRAALDALKVDATVLVVEAATQKNPNLELSARNIEGLELVRGNDVHPYHLLRYDRVIFSQPAIEKLQLTLKNSISKRQHKEVKEKEKSAKKATRMPRRRTRHEKAAEVA